MRRFNSISTCVFVMATLCLSGYAQADDEVTREPAGIKRNPQQDVGPSIPNAFDEEMGISHPKHKDKSMFGIHVDTYWDGLTTYEKLNPYGGLGAFSDQTTSGAIFGMQVLFQVVMTNWEFSTGFDYMFPINAQGAGVAVGQFVVANQTLNIMGFKAMQLGYRFDAGAFTIVPYGGIGFYYGKDVVNLTNSVTGAGQNDQITYSKLLCNWIAGARAEYVFPGSPKFALGLAAEFFLPTKIADQLSQSGTGTGINTSELPGYESNLQSNMDFMTNIGGRIMGNASVYF